MDEMYICSKCAKSLGCPVGEDDKQDEWEEKNNLILANKKKCFFCKGV